MTDEILRTERLELVDRHGRVRMVATCDADSGAPSLSLYDASGEPRVTVSISWDELPTVQLTGRDGKARAAIVVRPDDQGLLVVADAAGKSTAFPPEPTDR